MRCQVAPQGYGLTTEGVYESDDKKQKRRRNSRYLYQHPAAHVSTIPPSLKPETWPFAIGTRICDSIEWSVLETYTATQNITRCHKAQSLTPSKGSNPFLDGPPSHDGSTVPCPSTTQTLDLSSATIVD